MLSQGVKGVGRTAAAINHWLLFDRNDLPVDITQMSFDSYTILGDLFGGIAGEICLADD